METDILSWTALIALAVKTVSFIKQIAPNLNPWQIQLVAWIVAIAYVFFGAEVQVVQDFEFNHITLGSMEFATKIAIGLGLGSAGSLFGNDLIKGIDRNSTTNV